jgi:hypothetical protein
MEEDKNTHGQDAYDLLKRHNFEPEVIKALMNITKKQKVIVR